MGAITALPGVINSSNVVVTPSSYTVKASGVNYTISFKNTNTLPIGSVIRIGIPHSINTLISSVSGRCLGSTTVASPSSTTCTGVDDGTMYYVNFTGLFLSAAGAIDTTITLSITSIFTNPGST